MIRRVWGFVSSAFTRTSRWVASAFRGASHDPIFADWWGASTQHIDQEVRASHRDLRARARDLVRNNPYVAGVVDSFTDNIVGEHGIRLNPTNKLPNGEPAVRLNEDIRAAWEEWSMHENASVDGVDSWVDIQTLAARTWVVDGEVFVRKIRGADNAFGFALQVLDADMLDETYNVPATEAGGVEIRMGVEVDGWGKPLAYHFWRRHPHDLNRAFSRDRERVPASEVVHLFVRTRAGQTRGYTWLAPILTTAKMLDGYLEAEVVAARTAAGKMGVIMNKTPEAVATHAARLKMHNDRGDAAKRRVLEARPGLITELDPGQEFQGFDPTHPNAAADGFVKLMLRGVSRALGVSYLTLSGDVSAANYSSMRSSLIPERDRWKVLQNAVSMRLHRSVYLDWLPMAVMARKIRVPNASVISAHEWRGRRWQWVDPLKDIQAAELEIMLGLDSRQNKAAAAGRDFRRVVDETAEDEAYADEKDVYVGGGGGVERIDADQTDDETAPPPSNGNGNGTGAHRISFMEYAHGD